MTTTETSTPTTIARLIDCFRRRPGADSMMTAGVQAKGPVFVLYALKAVSAFEAFTADNDPYGVYDFGSFSLACESLFWKIDCYDVNSLPMLAPLSRPMSAP